MFGPVDTSRLKIILEVSLSGIGNADTPGQAFNLGPGLRESFRDIQVQLPKLRGPVVVIDRVAVGQRVSLRPETINPTIIMNLLCPSAAPL